MPASVTRLARCCIVGMVAFGLAACADPLPSDANAPVSLWSVQALVFAKPVLVGDAVVFITNSGRVESRRSSSGALVWHREIGTKSWGGALQLVAGRVIVPAYQLHGLDPESGATVWSYNGPDGRSGVVAPGVAGDVLYTADHGGVAAALSASDGSVLWSTDVGAALFTPVVHEDLLLYPTRGYLTGARDGPLGAGPIVALDRHTGEERWRFQLPAAPGFSASGGSGAPGVVVGDRLITGSENGSVYALRLTDGALLWQRAGSTAQKIYYGTAAMRFGANVTLTRSDNFIEALDPETGVVRWMQSAAVTATPQPCGQYLCLTSGRMIVLAPNGEIVWTYGAYSTGWTTLGQHAIGADGTIFVGVNRNINEASFEALRLPISFVQ